MRTGQQVHEQGLAALRWPHEQRESSLHRQHRLECLPALILLSTPPQHPLNADHTRCSRAHSL